MTVKSISEIKNGDVILDGGNRTTVTKVEACQSSKGTKTHINNNGCWENSSEIRIQN